jgi:hypothetical protein
MSQQNAPNDSVEKDSHRTRNEEALPKLKPISQFNKSYCLKKLESRWPKCIELKGDYVEK